MLMYSGKYQRDVYNCVVCDCWIGAGDLYCRDCGTRITQVDVYLMRKRATKEQKKSAPYHSSFAELIRCIQCSEFVADIHFYCKHCGHQFSSDDKNQMIEPGQNLLVGPALFVGLLLGFWLLVIFGS